MILTIIQGIFKKTAFNVLYFVSIFFNFTATIFVILMCTSPRNDPNRLFSFKVLDLFGYLAIAYYTTSLGIILGITCWYLFKTIYFLIIKFVFKKPFKNKAKSQNLKIIIDPFPQKKTDSKSPKKDAKTPTKNEETQVPEDKASENKEKDPIQKDTEEQPLNPDDQTIKESEVLKNKVFENPENTEQPPIPSKEKKEEEIESNLEEKKESVKNPEIISDRPTPRKGNDTSVQNLLTPSNRFQIQPLGDLYSEDSQVLPQVPTPNSNIKRVSTRLIKGRKIAASDKLYSSKFSDLESSNHPEQN